MSIRAGRFFRNLNCDARPSPAGSIRSASCSCDICGDAAYRRFSPRRAGIGRSCFPPPRLARLPSPQPGAQHKATRIADLQDDDSDDGSRQSDSPSSLAQAATATAVAPSPAATNAINLTVAPQTMPTTNRPAISQYISSFPGRP